MKHAVDTEEIAVVLSGRPECKLILTRISTFSGPLFGKEGPLNGKHRLKSFYGSVEGYAEGIVERVHRARPTS